MFAAQFSTAILNLRFKSENNFPCSFMSPEMWAFYFIFHFQNYILLKPYICWLAADYFRWCWIQKVIVIVQTSKFLRYNLLEMPLIVNLIPRRQLFPIRREDLGSGFRRDLSSVMLKSCCCPFGRCMDLFSVSVWSGGSAWHHLRISVSWVGNWDAQVGTGIPVVSSECGPQWGTTSRIRDGFWNEYMGFAEFCNLSVEFPSRDKGAKIL